MSDIEWDADDFEPPPNKAPVSTDKWEGEDEEDTIKDNWEDEEEEKKEGTPATTAPLKNKKKKLLKIAEKEAKQQEELERRKREIEERNRTLTPEEKIEEKLRLQKIQEDADFELASDLMGNNSTTAEEDDKLLDEIDLSDRNGLESFRRALVSKIRSSDRLEKRPFFVNFVEDLSRDLCQNLELEEVKRVSAVLNSLYNEKVKASKPKNKKKGGNKPKLNVASGAIIDIGNDFGAEYDDFM